jgi:hypothetical protein
MAAVGNANGVRLMSMKSKRLPGWIPVFTDAKDPAAFGMKKVFPHQIINPVPSFKGGIELDERLGPEKPLPEAFFNVLIYPWVPDMDKARNEGGIILNEMVAKLEDIHVQFLSLMIG